VIFTVYFSETKFVLIELPSLSITVPELLDEMYAARLFLKGSRPVIYTKILPVQGRLPSNILGVRKLETVGYPR